MKINQLLTTLLALSPGAALAQDAKDAFASQIPEGSATAIKKIAGALCSEAQEPDKPYLVKVGDASYHCDEESTGLVTNAAVGAMEEAIMSGRKKNQLAVKGGEHAAWGGFTNTVKKATNTVNKQAKKVKK